MDEIDPTEPPIFEVDDTDESDVEGDESRGGLTLEGVEIPFDLLQYGNGRLPENTLVEIGIGRHRLHHSAAAAFANFRAAATAAGIDLTLTDSYRSFDEQVDLKRRKPSLSATPGKSVHGWGFAVDVAIGTPPKGFGATVYSWLKANGPTIGWHLGRPKDEPWHWVYRGPIAAGPAATAAVETPAEQPADTLGQAADAAEGELVVGSTGERVRVVQECLRITADGQFGAQTEQAVIVFQQSCGLTADGRVGPKTGRAWSRRRRRPNDRRSRWGARAKPSGGCRSAWGSPPTVSSAPERSGP